jgi:putative alpha-1,2-mannosidase
MTRRLQILLCLVIAAAADPQALCGQSPVSPRLASPGALGKQVNPFIGTGGLFYLCGNEFPGVCLPFGMARLGPDTVPR